MNLIPVAMLGSTEILVIAVVVLVLFGAKKVPELMKGVGTGIKEFKKASRDVQDELHRAMDEVERTPPPPPAAPPATASVPVPKPDPDSHAHGSERPPEQKG